MQGSFAELHHLDAAPVPDPSGNDYDKSWAL
jgi:hypothetical protein